MNAGGPVPLWEPGHLRAWGVGGLGAVVVFAA